MHICYSGESGLVCCGYLDSRRGRDMVAIKTCKGEYNNFISYIKAVICLSYIAMSLASDKEKLLKKVTTMLSFDHPNVMSLIGVCIDGEMPMILMPFMSNGSVLGYVKRNKTKLLFDSKVNEEKLHVYIYIILLYLYTRISC